MLHSEGFAITIVQYPKIAFWFHETMSRSWVLLVSLENCDIMQCTTSTYFASYLFYIILVISHSWCFRFNC